MLVRSYQPSDYEQLKVLYIDSSTFGGQFDEARDAADRLQRIQKGIFATFNEFHINKSFI